MFKPRKRRQPTGAERVRAAAVVGVAFLIGISSALGGSGSTTPRVPWAVPTIPLGNNPVFEFIADGKHARVDGFVSLGVLASAAFVSLGFPRADAIIGLVITLIILRITWESWQTISKTEPAEMLDHND